ncbi:hypothetical protein RIF29_41412 [Crotalaria pallida]|uniref:Uncharacterized protein n=1 Tax=Crotalaria pallida TaxID=3830 RepID=A0AAN9HV92_CROPI
MLRLVVVVVCGGGYVCKEMVVLWAKDNGHWWLNGLCEQRGSWRSNDGHRRCIITKKGYEDALVKRCSYSKDYAAGGGNYEED